MSKHLANQIRAAAQRLRDAETAHQKIAEKLAAAQAAFPEAPSLADLELAEQDAAAAHALGEVDAGAVEAAREALAEAKAKASTVSAERAALQTAVDGLARRAMSAQLELDAAREAMQASIVEWLRAEMTTAEIEYLDAASAVVRAYARHEAAVAALQARGARTTDLERSPGRVNVPPIGAMTAAKFLEIVKSARDTDGANLAGALARGIHSTIENELADLIDPKQSGGALASFVRRLRAA